MDLSMILSPAVDAEEPAMAPPPSPPPAAARWHPDEVECAVSILHDFQAPAAASAASNGPVGPENGAGDENRRARANEAPSAVWGPQDAMSKLDLLVQADAAIKTGRAAPSSPLLAPAGVRSGVWTRAEEEYAAALMYYFLRGELEHGMVREGTTLRKFLAEMLGCNRRRVSMKLATEAIAGRKVPRKVGASVFVAIRPPNAPVDEETEAEMQAMKDTLADLRKRCFSDSIEEKGHHDGTYRHYHRDRSGSLIAIEHYPPHHRGDPLEEILDHPPQYHDETSSNAGHGVTGATSDDDDDALSASVPHKRTPRRRTASPLKKRGSGKSTAKAGKKHPTIIRTGFESQEEEEYVTSMIEFFLEGSLALPEGTPLVEYLCEQLQCSPRALSLKLAPRRASDPKRFPDNMGEITFRSRVTEMASAEYEQDDDDVSDEIFEVEARLGELRVACLEAHEKHLQEAPVVRITPRSVAVPSPSRVSPRPTQRRARSSHAAPTTFSRSGAWSREEEEYTAALIDRFFKGTLDIAEGTTLRAFLASKLQCNPMRVSKKLASECIADVKIPKKLGSSTFVRQRRNSNAGEEGSEYPPQVKPEHQISFDGKTDRPLRELERAFQRVDSAKHYSMGSTTMSMGAHSLKSPARGRRRKLPLSPSFSSPGPSRMLYEEESEDERLRRQVPQAASRHYGSHSSSDESDVDSMSKVRRTDYSRSPAAEAARARAHAAHERTASVSSVSPDGGPAAFESHIVPFSLREQVA